MSDILRNYEQQFGILCADITSKISRTVTNLGKENKTEAISAIEQLFQEAQEIIEQMELEIRDVNSSHKRTPEQKDKYMNIIGGYKSELTKLEVEFNSQLKNRKSTSASTSGGNRARIELSLNDSQDDNELNDLKSKNSESMGRMNKNLENGYRIVLESEEAGKNILSDLFSQREQMERSRDRLREINTNLGKSSRIVTAMTRKILQNKIVLFGLCAFLIVFVLFVIYLAIRRHIN